MRSGVARLAAFALAFAAVALGVFAWSASSTGPPPAPVCVPGEAVRAVPAATTGGASSIPAAAVLEASNLPRRADEGVGLSGVVFDDLGEPLPRILVYLRQRDAKYGGVDQCCTDARGRFRFPRAHDAVELSVEDGLVPARELVLSRGEAMFVELRAEQPCVVLEGTVRRGAEPAADRLVFVRDAEAGRMMASEATDAEGRYRHVLHPGRFTIEVARLPREGHAGRCGSEPGYPMGSIALDAAVRCVQRDFVVPANGIQVSVRSADDRQPVAGVAIQAAAKGRWAITVASDAMGQATFADLPAAAWSVRMESPEFAVLPERTVEVAPGSNHTVEFVVTRAGSVRVVLRGLDTASPRLQQALRSTPRLVLQPLAGGPALGVIDAMQGQLAFSRVSPGRYELRCDDLEGPQGWQYSPVAPFVAGPVDVRSGAISTIDVEARPRPSLSISVRDGAGKLWPLHATVNGPHGPVALTRSSQGVIVEAGGETVELQGDYEGFVPPGDYVVAVAAPSGRIEERVTVADRDLRHVVVVPGAAPAGNRLLERDKTWPGKR